MQPIRGAQWSGIEQRQHKRIPLGVPIECRSGAVTVAGRAENLSRGGILVRAEKTFPWDEEVAVSLVLPGSAQALQARARVTHVVPDAFMGLEFLDLSAESKDLIEKCISEAPAAPEKPSS